MQEQEDLERVAAILQQISEFGNKNVAVAEAQTAQEADLDHAFRRGELPSSSYDAYQAGRSQGFKERDEQFYASLTINDDWEEALGQHDQAKDLAAIADMEEMAEGLGVDSIKSEPSVQ